MKVISYLSSLPAKMLTPVVKENHKVQTLMLFNKGVLAAGDSGSLVSTTQYTPSDVAVILGWVHEAGKSAPHLTLRQIVIDGQKRTGGHTVIADSNLFLYSNLKNPSNYQRYSFDGIFPDTGIYCDTDPNPERWKKISNHYNIHLKDYRTNGNHILLCLQRNQGWSMGKTTVVEWTRHTVAEIRKVTNRPIVLRAHPGDKHATQYVNQLIASGSLFNTTVSEPGKSFLDDLKNCWAVVNHNSSPAVGAAIEGYPVFVTDPERSQCRDIANRNLSQIETPVMPDRQPWIERIAMSHWNFSELASGECWAHMRQFIK